MRVALLLIAFLAAMAAGARPAMADELLTTWRVGDLITDRSACHDEDAAIQVARNGGTFSVVGKLRYRCFRLEMVLAARLVRWVAGPFEVTDRSASVWQIEDSAGDTEFVLLFDESGRHKRAEAI